MPGSWEVVADGLAFPEGLRWRDGRLYFSDIFAEEVRSVVPGAASEVVATVPGRPSGLGWRPDGTLLVVNMTQRAVVAIDHGDITVVADLRHLTRGACNDMVVDDMGRAYVGHFGYDYLHKANRAAASIVAVEPDGSASTVADDVWFPNAMVLDGAGTLFVAETSAARITAFNVNSSGALSDRRLFADLGGARPDGMCLDADGALWVASPGTHEILRVGPDGTTLQREPAPDAMIQTVMLGGDDGQTLFAATSPTHEVGAALAKREGRIISRRVDVPHAGLP